MKFLCLLLGSTFTAFAAHAAGANASGIESSRTEISRTEAARTETARIEIEKFAFAPKEITVTTGTTLVWTNHDETPHTIIASDGSFVSKAMDTDDGYEHTFATAGDYTYFCTLHPYMTGTIHVRAATAAR